MIVTIEITSGKGAAAKSTVYQVDSDDMPLILLEALQTNQAKEMREGIVGFLGLSVEEGRFLTLRHVKAIGEALKAANDDPNGR